MASYTVGELRQLREYYLGQRAPQSGPPAGYERLAFEE